MSNFQIRWAEIVDVTAIAPLFDDYRQFYEKPSDLDFCQTFLKSRLEEGTSKVALAIDTTGTVIGFIQLYPLFSSLALSMAHTRVWLLNDLFVASAARNLGVGEALISFVQNFARETNVGYLFLETAHTNLHAQRLYEKLGWVRDQVFISYSWKDSASKQDE